MSASDDLKTLDKLLEDRNLQLGGSVKYKNKSYNLAELAAVREKVFIQVRQQQTNAPSDFRVQEGTSVFAQTLTSGVAKAQKDVDDAQDKLDSAINQNTGVAEAQRVLGAALRKLQTVNPKDKRLEGINVPSISRAGEEREGSTLPGVSLSTADAAERAAIEAEQKRLAEDKSLVVEGTPTEVVKNGVTYIRTVYTNGTVKDVQKVVSGGSDITPKVGATTDQPERKAFVDAELVARKLEDTPANRAMLRKEYNAKPATVPGDWEADLRTYMPGKAWMLELDRTKYTQLFDLLQRASDQNYYATPEGQKRFLGELDGTDFFKEIATSKQLGEIKKLVGDVGFDSVDFSKFVSDSINFGWTGDTLKAKTYEEVFRKNSDGSYSKSASWTITNGSVAALKPRARAAPLPWFSS